MLSQTTRLALGASATTLLLAACSGGGSSTPGSSIPVTQQSQMQRASSVTRFVNAAGHMGLPSDFRLLPPGARESSPGWMSEDATGSSQKVYVSDNSANAVYIYNAKKPTAPIGTITSGLNGPLGSFIDSKENLYVANLSGNSVTVYAKGKTTPSKTYTTGLSEPVGVAVGKDGTVYVSEFAPGQVVEYDKGATSPSRTITISESEGVALDNKNNLYVSYVNSSTGVGGVQKFKPKSTTGTDLGISVGFAGDIKLDTKNDIILGDQNAQTINYYKPGATTPYGSIAAGADPYKLALNSTEKLIYDATASNFVAIFANMPNGMSAGTITNGLTSAFGVSLTPPPPLD